MVKAQWRDVKTSVRVVHEAAPSYGSPTSYACHRSRDTGKRGK